MDMTLAPSAAITTIAGMITPALLILASASLVGTALVRMARVVDRARALAGLLYERQSLRVGVTQNVLRGWLHAHAKRAQYVERSVSILYAAVVVFVATCLSIALDRAVGGMLTWLPVSLA